MRCSVFPLSRTWSVVKKNGGTDKPPQYNKKHKPITLPLPFFIPCGVGLRKVCRSGAIFQDMQRCYQCSSVYATLFFYRFISLLVRGSTRLSFAATASQFSVTGLSPDLLSDIYPHFRLTAALIIQAAPLLSYPAYRVPLAGYIISNALSIAAFRASSRVEYTDLQVVQYSLLLSYSPDV